MMRNRVFERERHRTQSRVRVTPQEIQPPRSLRASSSAEKLGLIIFGYRVGRRIRLGLERPFAEL